MRKTKNSRLSLLVVLALLGAFVAVPAMAPAQGSIDDPSSAQYDPPIPDGESASFESGGSAGSGSSGSSGGSGLNSSIGSLPFTGMDLLILAGVALVLTGTGFALRRLSSPRGPSV